MQEEMERIRAERRAPVSEAEREEDERVLGFIERFLRRMNVEMSKVNVRRKGEDAGAPCVVSLPSLFTKALSSALQTLVNHHQQPP